MRAESKQRAGESAKSASKSAPRTLRRFIAFIERAREARKSTEPIYRALDPTKREFRLMDILPFSGKADDILVCRLRYASFRALRQPSYETVSYCWGETTSCRQIVLNGRAFEVPENTDKALRRVAKRDTIRTVWIDAVCINQLDRAEREQQVTMMRDIYSKTATGLIYLGARDREPARAMTNLEAIAKEVREAVATHKELLEVVGSNEGWIFAQSEMRTQLDTEALLNFFECPWFRRIWTMQEGILPPYSICFYGHLQISLDAVLDACVWLIRHSSYLPEDVQHMEPALVAAGIMWYARRVGIRQALLINNVLSSSSQLTSDDRDRVYGLLGLTALGDSVPDLIRPDYTKSYPEVMRDVMRYGIEVEDYGRCFTFIRHRSEDDVVEEGWPSWVPRVHRSFDEDEDAQALRSSGSRTPAEPIPLGLYSQSPSTLHLHGWTVGVISRISNVLLNPKGGFYPRGDIRDTMRSVSSLVDLPIDADTALHRTLIADHDYHHQRSSEASWADFQAFAAWVQGTQDTFPLGISAIDSQSQDAIMKYSRYFRSMEMAASNRKFVVTEAGHYGLVPKVCKEGDIIAILRANHVPVALRPTRDGRYYMLGEAYLDGFFHPDDVEKLELLDREPTIVALV